MVATVPAKQGPGYTIQVVALSHDRGFSDYAKRLPSDQPLWSNKKKTTKQIRNLGLIHTTYIK